MTASQYEEVLALPLAGIPSREAVAAWLELEATLISATEPGSDERKRLRLVMMASRPNDNDHVASAKRIARALRDPEASLPDILVRVRSARHFHAVLHGTISGLIGGVQVRNHRKEYKDAMGPQQEVERDDAPHEHTPGAPHGPKHDGPPVESVIDQ